MYICPKCGARLDPGEVCKCEPAGRMSQKAQSEKTTFFVIRDGKAFAVVR